MTNTSETAIAPSARVAHRAIEVDGLSIFYREAGDRTRPSVLLLHGFPSSSSMFRDLIPTLAERYHVIAPDLPGFGASDMPSPDAFTYTFDSLAAVMDAFLTAIDVKTFSVYVQDYGAPVGFRLFEAKPERVEGFIIQNGNAYEEGLSPFWEPLRALWRTNGDAERDALRDFLKIDGTKWQYLDGEPQPELISPDAWRIDQYLLDRPGNDEIQFQLFYDYRTNLERYAGWHALLRAHQPPALIVWGMNDTIFPAEGALAYRRDLENVELHLLDGGHFALESHGPFIAAKMLAFLAREVG